jgi:hypothetical protein
VSLPRGALIPHPSQGNSVAIDTQRTLSLPARQRRYLFGLTLALAGVLLALLAFTVNAASNGPEVPGLESLLVGQTVTPIAVIDGTPVYGPTPEPTRRGIINWVWSQGTKQFGEAPGPTSTPDHYYVFAPLLEVSDPQPGWGDLETQPEPPPVEPAPDWPAGLAGPTGSKLGLHAIANNDQYIMEFVRRVRPRVVKSVDDLGWLADVKRVSPNTVTIGRISGQDEGMVDSKDPVAAADAYIAGQLEKYRLNPGVDFWEGWNEFVPVNTTRMAWYAQFEARRACAMQALGLRAAVGGFSVGVPEYADMATFMPALEAAYRCGAIFTLHEYNSPTLTCGVRNNDANIIPGAPNFGGVLMGYHTLRYRFWYEGYLKPRGMGDLPLVISEAGVEGRPTAGGPCDDPGGKAWKNYGDGWVQRGFGPSPAEAYVNLLAWYDQELRKDAYVWGATLFTVGAPFGEGSWNEFDLHQVLVPLAKYEVTQP